MIFGKGFNSFIELTLNNESIEYVREWKYLGCLIQSGKEFSFSPRRELATFRCSFSSFVSTVRKPNKQVLMKLLHSFAIPIMTYASEVKRFFLARTCMIVTSPSMMRFVEFFPTTGGKVFALSVVILDITIFTRFLQSEGNPFFPNFPRWAIKQWRRPIKLFMTILRLVLVCWFVCDCQ